MSKTIAVLGTFDTKGEEFAYLIERIREAGCEFASIDTGIISKPSSRRPSGAKKSREPAETPSRSWSKRTAAGRRDRHDAKARANRPFLYESGKIDGIISMERFLREPPSAAPMPCTSARGRAAEGHDFHPRFGRRHKIRRPEGHLYAQLHRRHFRHQQNLKDHLLPGAGAVLGAAKNAYQGDDSEDGKKVVAASMFGVTTPCVTKAKEYLEGKGYEVLVFLPSGSGGIASNLWWTAEWSMASRYHHHRMVRRARGRRAFPGARKTGRHMTKKGIPQVVSCGALDMVNFGEWDSIPQKFKDRNLYKHNASVTLMRTTVEECAELGRIIAGKLNQCVGPCAMLPLGGVSAIDKPGAPLWTRGGRRAV